MGEFAVKTGRSCLSLLGGVAVVVVAIAVGGLVETDDVLNGSTGGG